MSTLQLSADGNSGQPLRQRIEVGGFTLSVDAPVGVGGSGSAPGPHELFDASLAACKTLTVTLYARRKGWPLDHVDVALTRDASTESEGTYRLDVALTLHGALDDTMRAQLLSAAERCPIHKLMTTTTVLINTHLA